MNRFSTFSAIASAAVLAVSTTSALAAPIEPPSWVRSADPLATATAEHRTYQQWDLFTTATGLNTPALTASATVAAFTPSVNPNGTATLQETSGSGLVTSTGNLYNFSVQIAPQVIVPLTAADGFTEAVTVQIVWAGNPVDLSSFTANGVAVSTLPGYALSSVGSTITLDFLLPDTNSLTFNYSGAASSNSLDVLAIDTRSTVPEPASLALLGLGGIGLLRRRR